MGKRHSPKISTVGFKYYNFDIVCPYFQKPIDNRTNVRYNQNHQRDNLSLSHLEVFMAAKEEIKKFAEDYYLENGVAPSIREIAQGIDLAKSSVQRYLKEMTENGEIEYKGRRGFKSETTEKYKEDQVRIGKVGSIACGPLTFAEQNVTDYFTLPASLVGHGEFFMLEASGNSMINAGISDGDLVIIRKQNTADDGQIVVALHEDETTLKRFYRDTKHKRFILHPENDEMEDIIIEDDIQIQGIAVRILKEAI